jgi:poly-gamma-glutamate synthesis protein (capsule biosynthesis protein)
MVAVREVESLVSRLTLAAVGDVMLGDHPVCFGHGVRSAIRKNGPHLFDQVAQYIGEQDVFLANLECVLSEINHDEGRLKSSEFRGDQRSAELLSLCGSNVVSVANNHMLQHGPEAFLDTVSVLRQHGVQPVGIYLDGISNVVRIDRGDGGIAIVACSFRPEHFCRNNVHYAHCEPDVLLGQLRHLRQSLPEHAIVVSLHWGEEYLTVPSRSQVELAHQIIDAGATLLVGHHPHVLQGVEPYHDGLIAYSLGNFVFDSWQRLTRESMVLACTFVGARLVDHSITPVLVDRKFSPQLPDGPDAESIREKINSYSGAIVAGSGLLALEEPDYAAVAEQAYRRYRMECYGYFLRNLWRYEPRIVFYSLARALLRKLGMA